MPANIKPLKMCINITIPSVEDTDLSLYEAMCTLASKLQDTINEINDILADVVVSVNGHQGPEVLLTGDDIPTSATISSPISTELNEKYSEDNRPPYPVTSVNAKTGAVEIKGDDISVSITDGRSIADALSQKYGVDNQPPYPVTSVNGKQGNVVINGDDVSVSSTDDQSISGVLGQKYSADNPPPYPVTSVNGRTGNVRLTAESIDTTEAGTSIQDELNALNAGLLQTFRTSNTVYTTWNSVKDLAPGAYKTNGFLPWANTISASGCLIIMQSGNATRSYIFIRDDVIDTLFFGINTPTSSADWFLIHGSPISG